MKLFTREIGESIEMEETVSKPKTMLQTMKEHFLFLSHPKLLSDTTPCYI